MGALLKELRKELRDMLSEKNLSEHSYPTKWMTLVKRDLIENETEGQRKLRLRLFEMFGDRYNIQKVWCLHDNDGHVVFVRNYIGNKKLIVEALNVVPDDMKLLVSKGGYCLITVHSSILNNQEQLDKKMDEVRLYLENPKVYRKTVYDYKKRNEEQTATSTPSLKQKDKEPLVLNSMRKNNRSCSNCSRCICKKERMGVCVVHKREVPLDSLCVRHKKEKR